MEVLRIGLDLCMLCNWIKPSERVQELFAGEGCGKC